MGKKTQVVIVGSGIVGMSTALWMLEDGKYDVTILEKSVVIPAPDAASTGDYADPILAKLSVEAIEWWRKPEWEGVYHESGIVCLSSVKGTKGNDFVEKAYENCVDLGLGATLLRSPTDVRGVFPPGLKTGLFGGGKGYHNCVGGWGESGRSVEVGLKRVARLGGKIRAGAEVVSLKKSGRKVDGVVLASGEVVSGDLVVLAAGAWTPALCAGDKVPLPPIVATGQSVAFVQLTPEEVELHSKTPIVFNLDNGFYCFPPNKDGIVKFAIHHYGHTNNVTVGPPGSTDKVSLPLTKLSPEGASGAIPVDMVRRLRTALADVYPNLAKKPFVDTRLCWYCDTVTGDWLIDYHPNYDNLVLATGDSGHAFKFAPIIGREILAIIERRAEPTFADRLSFSPTAFAGADVRVGRLEDLSDCVKCTGTDLQPPARL
ncbi:hypothetical protein Q8F55_002644 [Vanrija albida]|uniref:FAD dependent oxidoreductase domain-containing protein n=1 Tax=Vanrija albida TaxID=181172 RepID=A0ABR3QAE7_9TREE